MAKWLRPVRDRMAVEFWAFIALGLAPLCGYFYTVLVAYVSDIVHPDAMLYPKWISLVTFIGFYSPFILPIFWLRYHHREDEF